MNYLKRGDGNCPYSRVINKTEQRWYCSILESPVELNTFKKKCYPADTFRNCSVLREYSKSNE